MDFWKQISIKIWPQYIKCIDKYVFENVWEMSVILFRGRLVKQLLHLQSKSNIGLSAVSIKLLFDFRFRR